MNEEKYFLPYQIRWLLDKSRIKIWEKSRRIGATYAQSYEDVHDLLTNNYDVWFSSADESAAREYILYCQKWARELHAIAQTRGMSVIDSDNDIKAYTIEFSNGKRISAVTSNPKRFRSKGGKVVLDEYAWHDDQVAMWNAARPTITWGFPLRILSTHNGKSCRYYKFVDAVKKGNLKWSLHTTPIQLAVDEGLVDKILGHPSTAKEKADWLEETRADCFDENTWLQEYCCIPVDESSALLTYEMIAACESANVLSIPITGDLYAGMDIGRKKHLSAIIGLERLGHGLYTRKYNILEKAPFRHQQDALYETLRHKNLRRACIDATGLGMQLAEQAREAFGRFRVEAVTFTPAVKEELAMGLVPYFEDKAIAIPEDFLMREDLHSVRKIVTAAGNVRYDVSKTEEQGHADRFWALALAVHAAGSKVSGPVVAASRGTRESNTMLRGY